MGLDANEAQRVEDDTLAAISGQRSTMIRSSSKSRKQWLGMVAGHKPIRESMTASGKESAKVDSNQPNCRHADFQKSK